jgi:hypothetical protein
MLNGPSMRKKLREKAKFVAEYEAEARRPIDQMIQSNARLAAEIATAERDLAAAELMHTPSDYLAEHCTGCKNDLSPDDMSSAITDAVAAFRLQLHEQGIKLTDRGFQKFACVVQKNLSAVDTTKTKNLMTVFDYMDSLNIFNDKDISRPQKATPTQPVEPETLDLETLDVSNRAGRREAERLVTEDLVAEAATLYREFRQYLMDKFGYSITRDQGDACVNHIRRSNLSLTSKASWDVARKVVLNLKTPDEKLCDSIENSTEFVGSYSMKKELARCQRENQV